MSALSLQNLTKTFPGNTHAVSEVSLEINHGEFLVLVGPSGCGKSTTLRMIAGLEEITGGEIRIGERVVNGVPPKDRNISMVFQNYALYPHMTVRKNMSFGLELRYGGGLVERSVRRILRPAKATQLNERRKGIRSQVEQTAELLQIAHLLERMPSQLSGGERQRVALGRAIVREPEVFLFDEPLSNLDAKLRVEMRRELKQLHARLGTTMVYVTHDQVEAMTLGDRVAVMRGGKLQQVGPPLELYDRPANRFVASFMGSPSMNLLDAVVSRQEGNWRLRLGKESVGERDRGFGERREGRGEVVEIGSDVQGRGVEVSVPASWREAFANREGERVAIGIRPEDIRLRSDPPTEAGEAMAVAGEVMLVETLGDSSLVTLKLLPTHDDHSREAPLVIAKTKRGERLQTGERKSVIFDSSRVHLFAGEHDCRVEVGKS